MDPLKKLRDGAALTTFELLKMTVCLSLPAIFAQISSIVMQYIDASMVGHLGSTQAASIGLVSTTLWLFGGLCMAMTAGFTIQIAQAVGAKDNEKARSIVKQGLLCGVLWSALLTTVGVSIHGALPSWLHGDAFLAQDASTYFFISALMLPLMQVNHMAAGMIQCSGNMKLPSFLHILMCALDVVFNALLIFPSRTYAIAGRWSLWVPGADLGVAGAALGTAAAEAVVVVCMLFYLFLRSPILKLQRGEPFALQKDVLQRALKLSAPIGFEQIVMCGAYIAATRIVAPLGFIAVAANSFAVTAESLCYMPGYGVSSAATTLIGQATGAKRETLTRKLAWLTTGVGVSIMTIMGALMFLCADLMIACLSPDPQIRALGADVLRIVAMAEAFYGASIVANGVFRGAGDTLVPSCLSFGSMWLVRIPLSACLAVSHGLKGVWIAMALELTCRGLLFIARLKSTRWMKKDPERT